MRRVQGVVIHPDDTYEILDVTVTDENAHDVMTALGNVVTECGKLVRVANDYAMYYSDYWKIDPNTAKRNKVVRHITDIDAFGEAVMMKWNNDEQCGRTDRAFKEFTNEEIRMWLHDVAYMIHKFDVEHPKA